MVVNLRSPKVMKRKKTAFILLAAGALLLVLALLFAGIMRANGAGLLVESDTPAQVYINGELQGRTPFRADLSPTEVTIKLVPDAIDKPLVPFETKVSLEAGIQTIVRRNLGETTDTSSGEVISFKKIGGTESSVAIVSTPDGAQVKFDEQIRGTTPLTLTNISSGIHQLTITATGYQSRSLSLKAAAGYRLTAVVNLAVSNEPIPTPTAVPKETETSPATQLPEVEILNTSVGFLRVREEPSTGSKEIGRVKPGQKFELLQKDEQKGWFRIAFEEGKEGWISQEFATVSAKPKQN